MTARSNDVATGYNLAIAPPVDVDEAAGNFMSETNTAAPFSFSNQGATQFQFQVNNTLYPNWGMTGLGEIYQHTKLAVRVTELVFRRWWHDFRFGLGD